MSIPQNYPFSVYLRKLVASLPDETETRGCYSGNPVEGALLFHNLHFRPHPYDRSNRIDTARRCHCCHILMLIQNFWEIASNHQCIILSPSFCWGDILSGKYSSLNPSFDSYHLIFEAPWSSQVILPSLLAVKMSVPQNSLFSVFFEKILIGGSVTWWNCSTSCRLSFSFTIPNSCRSNSE